MTEPSDWRLNRSLAIDGRRLAYHFVNSGVPHVVTEVENLEEVEVVPLGRAVRHHADFAPAGTNVNFVAVTGPHSLSIRTYERGVEAETMACGTGIVASALIAGRLGWVKPPVQVRCAGGVLEVNYRLSGESAQSVTLVGPAVHVFEGTVRYPLQPSM